jgi:hypothetical protein
LLDLLEFAIAVAAIFCPWNRHLMAHPFSDLALPHFQATANRERQLIYSGEIKIFY